MANKKVIKVYEAGLHLIPTIEEGEVSNIFDEIKKAVTAEEKSEILSEKPPEPQKLAYMIRHTIRQSDGSYSRYDESYFGSIKFRATQEGVMGVKKSLQGNENVLRFIVLETVEEDTRVGEKLPGEEEEETTEVDQEKRSGKKGREAEDGLAENSDDVEKNGNNDDKK